jgi:hypothetical protein
MGDSEKVKPTDPTNMREELNNALITMWALIPQSTINKLCEGFQSRLELCLANGGGSISNQLWRLTERSATNHFLLCNTVSHVPWTAEEDDRLMQHYLAIGPRWKVPGDTLGVAKCRPVKKSMVQCVGACLHGPETAFLTLRRVPTKGRKRPPAPSFRKT